jgi:hypothetical protein
MKKTFLAALTVVTFGAGSAFAQGVPPGYSAPVYGSHAFAGHGKELAGQTHFLGKDTVLGKFFGHSAAGKVKAG